MKLFRLLAMILIVSTVLADGSTSVSDNSNAGNDGSNTQSEDAGSSIEDDYIRPNRPLESVTYDDEMNQSALEKAYSQTKTDPKSANLPTDTKSDIYIDIDKEGNLNRQFIDFDDFFAKLKNIDCSKFTEDKDIDYLDSEDEDEITNLCDKVLQSKLLLPMARADHHPVKLFKYLKKNVYLPLGIDLQPKFTYPDVLTDTFFLKEDQGLINKDLELPTNEKFSEEINDIYREMEKSSANFEENKEVLSEKVIDVLKRFHIFWNVHRARGEMKDVEKNTLEIIKSLIKTYKATTNTMKLATTHILQSIKDGYFKFIRAYRMWQVLKDKPLEIVALQVIRRYKENIERIRLYKSSRELMTSEIAYIVDMVRAFFILNYKKGIQDEESIKRFEMGILKKISYIYDIYRQYLIDNGEICVEEIKTFTATLLLKILHRKYIMFTTYTIDTYIQLPSSTFESTTSSSIKIYYELFDNFLLVPSQCADLVKVSLDKCVTQKIYSVVQNFYSNYQLFASVNGNSLLSFIRMGVSSMIKSFNDKNSFESYPAFKVAFMNELFRFASLYRQKYHIRDMKVVDDFENDIGFEIERTKDMHQISATNFVAIDKLDKLIYDYFLTVKTKFNQLAPISQDQKIMKLIVSDLEKLLDGFTYNKSQGDDESIQSLLNNIKKIGEAWLREHSVFFIINSHSVNTSPQVSKHAPINIKQSLIVPQVLNDPAIVSGLLPNMYTAQMGLQKIASDLDPQDLNKY